MDSMRDKSTTHDRYAILLVSVINKFFLRSRSLFLFFSAFLLSLFRSSICHHLPLINAKSYNNIYICKSSTEVHLHLFTTRVLVRTQKETYAHTSVHVYCTVKNLVTCADCTMGNQCMNGRENNISKSDYNRPYHGK